MHEEAPGRPDLHAGRADRSRVVNYHIGSRNFLILGRLGSDPPFGIGARHPACNRAVDLLLGLAGHDPDTVAAVRHASLD